MRKNHGAGGCPAAFGMRMVSKMASSVSSRAGFRADTGLTNQSKAPVQRVEEQADILQKKDAAACRGRGLKAGKALFDVLLRLGHVEMAADHVTKGVQPFLLILQPQQRPGVALREAVFHQQAAAFRGEPQQPQLIGKGGGGTAQSGGGLLLRGAERRR